VTVTEASPRRDQSLRGHTAEAAEGFPRHYPPVVVSSLVETTGLGFAVMSGSSHGITPVQGKPNLPDKEFRYLRHFVTRNAITSITSTNLTELARTFLPGSLCRHRGRTVSSRRKRESLATSLAYSL
jgi:hypothetical protein